MNRISFLVVVILMTPVALMSQSSYNRMHYQAALKYANGQPYANLALNLKVEIRYSGTSGLLLFDETHLVNSNVNGYVAFDIGSGTALLNGTYNSFDQIYWKDTLYHLNIYTYDSTLSQYTLTVSQVM